MHKLGAAPSLAYMLIIMTTGFAWAQNTPRTVAVEKCWMEAHKEYPSDSGNDVDNSAIAKTAYSHYSACMQKLGLDP